ncbi:MAG: matrixin family metalloprotease [Ferruginibacter sp.]
MIKFQKYPFFIFFILCNASCNNNRHEKKQDHFIIIDIQPFEGIAKSDIAYVANELGSIYPHIQIRQMIDLPEAAFYPARNRYRADSLIAFLNKRTREGHITIGLTDKDISATKDAIKDWGIMGLGNCPGNACIASSFRLSKTEKQIQLFKVAIHELGHTQGLAHCSVKSCFMRDAEGKNTTNEETAFCSRCKQVLINKGWKFNN